MRLPISDQQKLTEKCEFFLPHSHLTPSLVMNPYKFLDELFVVKTIDSLGYP